MDSYLKKGIASILILTICSMMFIGCKKKELPLSTSTYVSDVDPWYSCEEKIYNEDLTGNESVYTWLVTPEIKVLSEAFDSVTREPRNMLHIFYGNEECCLDMDKCFDNSMRVNLCSVSVDNQKLYFCFYKMMENGASYCVCSFDKNTNSLTDEVKVNFENQYAENTYIYKMVSQNGITYIQFSYSDGYENKNSFLIIDGETQKVIDVNEIVWNWYIRDDYKVGLLAEDKETHVKGIYSLDLKSGENTLESSDETFIEEYWYGYMMEDGCVYKIDHSLNLWKYDINTSEEKLELNFNDTNGNLSVLSNSTLMYVSGDEYIFARSQFYAGGEISFNKLLEVKKEEKNPNSGKQILMLAPFNELSVMEANAIQSFNSRSSDCFLKVTMDYNYFAFELPQELAQVSDTRSAKRMAILSQLKQDIVAGVGPDILLNFGEFNFLNQKEYLVNLYSSIYENPEVNLEDYFENILNAYKMEDDCIYQIPVSASVAGLYIKDDIWSSDKPGVTFDEYETLIENCSGYDPIACSADRRGAFEILVKSQYDDLHDENDHIVLNDTFKSICSLTKNIPEDGFLNEANTGSKYIDLSMISFDLEIQKIKKNGYSFYGLPSADGMNGPIANIYESVAVTSNCSNKDLATSFALELLSYDVQITNERYNPINRKAYDFFADRALEYANTSFENLYGFVDFFSEEILDEYKNCIESANTCSLCDEYSLVIMNEELQAYYSNQKSIEQVVEVIEDRVNTMIDEQK